LDSQIKVLFRCLEASPAAQLPVPTPALQHQGTSEKKSTLGSLHGARARLLHLVSHALRLYFSAVIVLFLYVFSFGGKWIMMFLFRACEGKEKNSTD